MKKIIALIAVALMLIAAGCAKNTDGSGVATETMSNSDVQGADQSNISESAAMDQQQSASIKMANEGLQRIHFAFDQYTLSAQAKDTLAANARFINNFSGFNVKIEGHCDERGSDEYNLALGEKRARAAQKYLLSLGVDGSRLSVISYGEEKPLVSGSTAQAYAKNRRAEFTAR